MSCLVEEAPVAAAGGDETPASACVATDDSNAWERFRREQAQGRTWTMPRHWRDEEGL